MIQADTLDTSYLKIFSKNKLPQREVHATSMTYTQILQNADKSKLIPTIQGYNRDAIEVSIITPDVAVCALADGCALRYWSEVCAKVAVNKFVSYMEKYIWSLEREVTIAQLKQEMISALLYTNNQLLNFENPVTKEIFSIEEKGGQTTLVAALVFPFGGAEEENWGVIAVGVGDSEVVLFSGYSEEVDNKDNIQGQGQWHKIVEDDGGLMLPFTNLKESKITKPLMHVIDKNTTVFLMSDGVRSSFPDLNLPQIPETMYSSTWFIGNYLMQQTYDSHISKKTDPDDVSLVVLRLSDLTEQPGYQYLDDGYPYRQTKVDLTETFYHDFMNNEGYDVNLVNEYIDENDKLQKNNRKVMQVNARMNKKIKCMAEKKKKPPSQQRVITRSVTAPVNSIVTDTKILYTVWLSTYEKKNVLYPQNKTVISLLLLLCNKKDNIGDFEIRDMEENKITIDNDTKLIDIPVTQFKLVIKNETNPVINNNNKGEQLNQSYRMRQFHLKNSQSLSELPPLPSVPQQNSKQHADDSSELSDAKYLIVNSLISPRTPNRYSTSIDKLLDTEESTRKISETTREKQSRLRRIATEKIITKSPTKKADLETVREEQKPRYPNL